MLDKIKNLIKFVTIKKHIDKRRMEIEYLGIKGKKVICLIPYGMFCKIGSEINGLAFQQEGNEDSLFVIPADFKNLEMLENDEVYFGIPSKKARLKFKNDGKINIRVGDSDSTDYAVRYNEMKTQLDQLKTDFNDLVSKYNVLVGFFNGHVHAGVTAGGASTSAVAGAASTDSSSTADFSNCKVSKINIPSVSED